MAVPFWIIDWQTLQFIVNLYLYAEIPISAVTYKYFGKCLLKKYIFVKFCIFDYQFLGGVGRSLG